ncbi:MAG: hypothetical protein LBP68_04070 [Acidobacteriota bacterium]|jgi:hypothetical protein|nr:hypothetical protein [Acidobacteriota bacterium]
MDGAMTQDANMQPEDKAAYRAYLRNLPYPEKVRIVVELQKIAAPILRARGRNVFVWSLDDERDAQAGRGQEK